MAKESREMAKRVTEWPVSTYRDAEKWFEDIFWRPFPLIGYPLMRFAQVKEIAPLVDIFEDKDDIVIKAELPGINKEEMEISLTKNTITISGEKKKEQAVEKKDFYRWECSYGSFTRTLNLPSEVQIDKAKTKMKDGVLEIRVPKTKEAKEKEVKVKIE